jgi:hypothetical protein
MNKNNNLCDNKKLLCCSILTKAVQKFAYYAQDLPLKYCDSYIIIRHSPVVDCPDPVAVPHSVMMCLVVE